MFMAKFLATFLDIPGSLSREMNNFKSGRFNVAAYRYFAPSLRCPSSFGELIKVLDKLKIIEKIYLYISLRF
tara:strand:+ start:311 stop:526 length:216 start_codon:yes stop_codon:yes gene_type:complete